MRYQQNGLTVGLVRRLNANISTKLQYGFYNYEEPATGGAYNYTANAIFATLVMRLP